MHACFEDLTRILVFWTCRAWVVIRLIVDQYSGEERHDALGGRDKDVIVSCRSSCAQHLIFIISHPCILKDELRAGEIKAL